MTEKQLRHQIILDAGVRDDFKWAGERITYLLNQAQDWLQMQLIKQGARNWKKSTSANLSDSTLLGLNTSTFTSPSDHIKEVPFHYVSGSTWKRPASRVEFNNFYDAVTNEVLAPALEYPIFTMLDDDGHIYPQVEDASATLIYTYKITDLVYNNDSTQCEFKGDLLNALIERVVMQIKSANGMEDIKQAKLAEINQYIIGKYQLDNVKPVDKEPVQ